MPIATVNGVNLYFEWHGPASRPVLVLNNGILMNAAGSWLPQTDVFASSFRVLQYDCRGQGRSDHPDAPYSMDLHADDLCGLLDTQGVRDAHILGISYGGEVAQAFALKFPTRLRSLVLAATVSEVGPELRLIVEGWKAAALSGHAGLFYLVTAPWNFSPGFIATHQALLDAARARYDRLDFAAVARLSDAFDAVDFTDRLAAITVPTCVVVGDADLLKGPRYAEIIHRAITGSELHLIPGAGHAVTWEDPVRFNAIVLDFLNRVEASRT